MENALGVLLTLLRGLRAAATPEALHFAIVNDTRRLVAYRRAILLTPSNGGGWRAVAASGASQVDRLAPLIQRLERLAADVAASENSTKLHPLPPTPQDQSDFGVGQALWLPLSDRGGDLVGALWLDRPAPWSDAEAALLAELADAQAYTFGVVAGRRRLAPRLRRWGLATAAVALAAMLMPMERAALAPVEIVARNPEVVAAPIDGVIRQFDVQPNQRVQTGDLLFRLDDTDRRARAEVAAKALDVAKVEYRQASQGALGGRRDAPRLAALESQIALKEIELENARRQLERAHVRAGRDGVALLPDVQEYLGRPVAAGERVMLVADPAESEARAWLAVRDAMPVADGAAVRLFLDADPLNPLDGKVARIRHEAEETAAGMAYRVMIELDPAAQAALKGTALKGQGTTRIGARGTARIDGDQAPLFLHLFRRPIAALRQSTGF